MNDRNPLSWTPAGARKEMHLPVRPPIPAASFKTSRGWVTCSGSTGCFMAVSKTIGALSNGSWFSA